MSGKRLLTLCLLLFVTVSAASIFLKEKRRRNSEGPGPAVEAGTAVPRVVDAENNGALSAAAEVGTREAAPKRSAPEPPSSISTSPAPKDPASLRVSKESSRKVIVYYLHTTARCASCYRIENWTAAAVAGDFGPELGAGLVEWKVLNVEEPPNAHFIEDYQLFTKSVVLSEIREGTEVRWKRLDRVWDLLDDEEAFRRYVSAELRRFLESA